MKPDWYPDELALAGAEHLDADYVDTYDAKAQTDHSEDIAVLQEHGLGPTSIVVDIGAGTGTFTLAVAPQCRRVVAVDISPAMLDYLQAQAGDSGLDNIEVVQGGLLSYEHSGAPADFVYSRNTLHHVSDFWKGIALQRMADMLRPGGILRLHDLVYDFDPAEAPERIAHWLAGAQPTPATGWTADELAQHLREEHSTYRWLMEPLLERSGFEILEATYRPIGTYAAYTCRRR